MKNNNIDNLVDKEAKDAKNINELPKAYDEIKPK